MIPILGGLPWFAAVVFGLGALAVPPGGAAQPPGLPGRRLSHRPTTVAAVPGPRSGAAGKPGLGPLLQRLVLVDHGRSGGPNRVASS